MIFLHAVSCCATACDVQCANEMRMHVHCVRPPAGDRPLTFKEIQDLPVAPTEHHIVKDMRYGFRCQKCSMVGDCTILRAVDCTWTDMVDVQDAVGALPKATGTVASNEVPPGPVSSEADLLTSLHLQELELELLLEEQALAEQLASMAELQRDSGACKVARPTLTTSTQESSQRGVESVTVSQNHLEALQPTPGPVPGLSAAEAAAAKRKLDDVSMPPPKPVQKVKKTKRPDEDGNPFDLPPDANQARLFDLKGWQGHAKPSGKTPCILAAWYFSYCSMAHCSLAQCEEFPIIPI